MSDVDMKTIIEFHDAKTAIIIANSKTTDINKITAALVDTKRWSKGWLNRETSSQILRDLVDKGYLASDKNCYKITPKTESIKLKLEHNRALLKKGVRTYT